LLVTKKSDAIADCLLCSHLLAFFVG
jgi:hypothetical protein